MLASKRRPFRVPTLVLVVEKAEVLDEIRRCAERKGGVPLGRERFREATGITQDDWLGRYWVRWGHAIREAGLEPNVLTQALDEDGVLTAFAELTRKLGRFPTHAERKMHRRTDPSFPSHGVFARFGNRSALAARMVAFCDDHDGWEDIRTIFEPLAEPSTVDEVESDSVVNGVVYLIRSGRHLCGRSAKEVRSVIEAEDGSICNECLDLCIEVARVGLSDHAAELPSAREDWVVDAIAYYPGLATTECRIEIEVSRPAPPERRTIMCEGVAELVLGPTSTNMPYALQIVPIDDRGWDRLRYRVNDGVDGQIRFYCREVNVFSETLPATMGSDEE